MIRIFTNLLIVISVSVVLSGCATIVGGSKYAHVDVANRPHAQIYYNGQFRGTGYAFFKVKRFDANKVSLVIKEEGYQDQAYNYHTRSFRAGAFVGTLLGWTGVINGFPIPWGVIVDYSTGAVYKPNVKEPGIYKMDYKNFRYHITSPATPNFVYNSIYDDIVYLKNGTTVRGVIIEQIPNVQIRLQSRDGRIFVYKMDEIERMVKEEAKF